MSDMPDQPREIFPIRFMRVGDRPTLTGGVKEGVIEEGKEFGPVDSDTGAVRDFRPTVQKVSANGKPEGEKSNPKGKGQSATPSVGQSETGSSASGSQTTQTKTPLTPQTSPSAPPVDPVDAEKVSPQTLAGLPMRTIGAPLPPAETTGGPKTEE